MIYNNSRLFIIFGLVFLLISPASQAKTEDPSSIPAIVAKHVQQNLDRNADLEGAHKTLSEALKTHPKSPSLNYQLARYILKTGPIIDKSLLGYKYKEATAEQAIETLGKVISYDETYGDAYSLLGHIYTAQGMVEEADTNFSKAEATKQTIPWLSFNRAQLYVQKNDMTNAAKTLNKIASKRPAKGKTHLQNIYQSSWILLKKIALKEQKYDPNETVRNGYATRVSPENIVKYLEDNKSDKLTFIHFASNDQWCAVCIRNNKSVGDTAKKYHKDVDFIHVSFEPWESVKYSVKDLSDFSITGLPTNAFYKQGKKIAIQPGHIPAQSLEKYIAKTLK